MEQPLLVQRVQPAGHRRGDPDRLVQRQLAVAQDAVLERSAGDEDLGQVGDPLVLALVDDRDDVRMFDALGDARLAVEAAAEDLVACEISLDDLDRGLLAEQVRPVEDAAHPALAQLLAERPRPDHVACRRLRCHGGGG